MKTLQIFFKIEQLVLILVVFTNIDWYS